MKPFTIAGALAAVSMLTICAEEKGDPKRAANTVILDETAVKNLGIETVEVEETDFEETVFALGRIEVLPGKKAIVSSRIEGRAVTVIALPDMKCEEGDELLSVESRQSGNPVVNPLYANMGGIIAKVNVAPGQPVSPDDSLMEIHDLETVEAAAAVPEHFAGRLQKGIKAHIRVPGFPDKEFEAELAHIGAELDRDSGTIEAAFHVANPDLILRPGMRAEFSIVLSKREGVLSVPRAALQGDPANRFVYVEDLGMLESRKKKLKKDKDLPPSEIIYGFVKTPVQIGKMNDRNVEILNGVLLADEIVARGAYSLAFAGQGSMSLKEALDAAHGHEHNEDGSEMTPAQKAAKEAAKTAAGGHAHGEAEGGGGFWKIVSGVLGALLVFSVLRAKRAPAEAGDTEAKPSKKTDTEAA